MTILITAPNYDEATSYLYAYAKDLVKDIDCIMLEKPRLTKWNVENVLDKKNPSLILFHGHGTPTTICGNNDEILIQERDNHSVLQGRLTYALACSAAASLGEACVQNNGCFIGYTQPFTFWTDQTRVANPLHDKVAKLALEPSFELSKALLRGKSAQEAVGRFQTVSRKNMLKILRTKKEPGAMAKAMVLWNNMSVQKICGDGDMKAV